MPPLEQSVLQRNAKDAAIIDRLRDTRWGKSSRTQGEYMNNGNMNCKCGGLKINGGRGRRNQLTEDWAKCSCGNWRLLPPEERPQMELDELVEAITDIDDNVGNLSED